MNCSILFNIGNIKLIKIMKKRKVLKYLTNIEAGFICMPESTYPTIMIIITFWFQQCFF